MLRPRMDSPAAQAVLDMTDPAYRREDVRAALILNIKVRVGEEAVPFFSWSSACI